MKKLLFFSVICLFVYHTFSQSSVSMEEVVRYLASPELEGRKTGTKGDSLALTYLVNQFEKMDIKPFLDQYEAIPYYAYSKKWELWSKNVIAFVEGTDSVLKGQYILVCAHFDHLGIKKEALYPGANDNASGTATVLYLADYFAKNPTKKSIIFACFSGEELGLLGSKCFVKFLPKLLPNIQCVVNFDMVGRYDQGGIRILGKNLSKLLNETVKKTSEKEQIKTKQSHVAFMRSDQHSFYQQKIPFLCFNTGNDLKNYHTPKDDADKIDFKGMVIVAKFAAQIVQELGNEPKKPILNF
ncbi:MAG: M28 family peptidase [Bacteroidetes bacterium]|nr:M28 family peptidase [Bacteroidota bacterium]